MHTGHAMIRIAHEVADDQQSGAGSVTQASRQQAGKAHAPAYPAVSVSSSWCLPPLRRPTQGSCTRQSPAQGQHRSETRERGVQGAGKKPRQHIAAAQGQDDGQGTARLRLTMMRPSILRLACSYSHTWMRDFCKNAGTADTAVKAHANSSGRRPCGVKTTTASQHHAPTFCKNLKIRLMGCVITFWSRADMVGALADLRGEKARRATKLQAHAHAQSATHGTKTEECGLAQRAAARNGAGLRKQPV